MMRMSKAHVDLSPIKIEQEMVKKVDKEEVDEPLSPKARLFHAPGLNCCVVSMLGSRTKLNVDAIKVGLEHPPHPHFSTVLVMDDKRRGEMKWRKTKIDVDNHVIVPSIDPDNIKSPDKFVEDYVANLTMTPMDLSKPLWELHLLNLQTSDAEAVIILRSHHSIGDGASLMSYLFTSSHRKPSLPHKSSLKDKKEIERVGFWRRFLDMARLSLQMIWNTFVGVCLWLATALFLKDTETPIKGGVRVELNPKRFVRRTFTLDDIKLVKNAMNGTVNDVLLGITEAGLSRYLNRRYGEDDKVTSASAKKDNLPKDILLRATHYVNLRIPPTESKASAHTEDEKKIKVVTGTKVGYILLPFSIAMRNDPLEYIHNVKSAVDRRKSSLEASFSLYITGILLKYFGFKAIAALYYRILSNTTMTYTNMVGSLEEVDYLGHPLTYIAFGTYGYPRTLSIHFISYIKKMTMLIAVDEGAIPDPDQLCDDIGAALQSAKDAVIQRGLVN
ncbi:wax ester synthase/diacylglycerol acyltransferase 11-like isoform X2 [Syzygium oleosum]|uniref:wax ester synthase/diacylglycerol acyltransferase 11-like isoform X2 n=1 Tax=Syzygium oleosum TaxID=219896 RepID=UPI0011D1DBF9|nr:wax ester synthase/diacylglycerol acyltransferase 11-like isoform X2 [Syzygium oleosum]